MKVLTYVIGVAVVIVAIALGIFLGMQERGPEMAELLLQQCVALVFCSMLIIFFVEEGSIGTLASNQEEIVCKDSPGDYKKCRGDRVCLDFLS